MGGVSGATDFLLELLSEEIPARMQGRARGDLARMLAEGLGAAGLAHEGIVTYSTPRRLVAIVRELPAATEAQSEELKGPRTSAPPQALEGFLRKTDLTRDQLEDCDGIWFARIDRPGRATGEVLAELVAQIVRGFPWPKSMRWGDESASTESLRWVRPLHSIVALLGEDIVPVEIHGANCSATTLGHRFHHPGPITIGGAHDYVEKLRACHVIVDPEEREALIRERTRQLAEDAGYILVADERLVVENAGLTEWPVPLLGSFDPDYLDVPEEVIQLTARLNQKYFVMRERGGALAPHFICVANIDAAGGGDAICAGNSRVLAARLSDARFFWQQDLKVPLEEQAKKLGGIVFHEKLGTIADKVERVAKLARWLVEEGIVSSSPLVGEAGGGRDASASQQNLLAADAAGPHPTLPTGGRGSDLATLTERAAGLCKADLVTGMVGEFPELQGVIGGHLARARGESDAIADAIRDHYKPVGQGDEVPTAPVTVAVSLADKLDTLAAYFYLNERPTGSKDPYALRRAALQAIRLITSTSLRLRLLPFLDSAAGAVRKDMTGAKLTGMQVRTGFADTHEVGSFDILDFIADRLKVQQREAGVRHDLIDAVFALGGEDDLVRLLARVTALQAFVETKEGADLLTGYKRAANILKKEGWDETRHPGLEPGPALSDDGKEGRRVPDQVRHDDLETAEVALLDALDSAEPTARTAVEAEDFTAAMAALASLRSPIDAFFDKVTVNADDPAVRARRLSLLARFRDAVHTVADFSKIEG